LIRSNNPRELLISANTRESRIATYLEGWKRKIERVGTMNFPDTRGALRNPVLEVAVSETGELKDVIVVRSSGDRKLDQAAVNILRMASPFDPFPDFLRRDYDVLRFSYEWYFTGNVQGSKLSVSP
jgi:protein TonB